MKLLLSSMTTAALALVASAIPLAAGDIITTELPAKFAMYLVTDEPRASGLRIRYIDAYLHIGINESPRSHPWDAVFLGGRGRIAVVVPSFPTPPPPYEYHDGDYNLLLFPGVARVMVANEAHQAVLDSWGPSYHPTVDHFVQDSNGILQLTVDGLVQPNGQRICGTGASPYIFWWDDVSYLDCPVAQFRVVAL